MSSPNIIYIHSHDSGRYIQPLERTVRTPAINELASKGILFDNMFATAPQCCASRASLQTGQWPHECGMLGQIGRGFSMPNYDHIWSKTFKAANYTTVLAGMQHITPETSSLGYDHYLNPPSLSAKDVAHAAAGFIQSRGDRPFFMDIGFSETHRPFPAIDNVRNCSATPEWLPEDARAKEDYYAFQASLTRFDDGVSVVMEALRKSHLKEKTLVICTTDHGIPFPGHKCNLNRNGLGVFCIMTGPPPFDHQQRAPLLLSQIDLFPTLCEWLNIPRPKWLSGRSFLSALESTEAKVNEAIFGTLNFHGAYEPTRAIRTESHHYIRRFHEYPFPILANCDESPTKDVLIEGKWPSSRLNCEELYDLSTDHEEMVNLAQTKGNEHILEDLRIRLHEWMVRTKDPLLDGPIAPPHPELLNDPTDKICERPHIS